MDAQIAQSAPLRATSEFCTFAAQAIRALRPTRGNESPLPDWYEVLIRPWRSYRHWSPAHFVDQLYRERPALSTDLEVLRRAGDWVLSRSCPTRISINTHPESLATRLFHDEVLDVQRRAAENGHSLCLELIEFGQTQDMGVLVRNAMSLRQEGVLIALDDFGSGVNCFHLCAAGIVDLIKIDIGIVRRVHMNGNERAIVQGICTLAEGLDARVIAEGVENENQLDALHALGVEYAQGFYFHKPEMLEI